MTSRVPTFKAPWWQPGGHLQTLVPRFARRPVLTSQPVEIPLPDGDRLVADLYPDAQPGKPLVIISHGLEGNSQRAYVLGLAQQAQALGYPVLAWNLRGCGRADNLTPTLYHSGASYDLDAVITWAAEQCGYTHFVLAGFSLGGNMTLKWLGEQGPEAARRGVRAAATASVPADLRGCAIALERPANVIYRRHFVRAMKARLQRKAAQFPEHFDTAPLAHCRTLWQLDDYYTAPHAGFRDAEDYYRQCSARFFLAPIDVPTLMVSARNDPFLTPECFPEPQAAKNAQLPLEITASGGHVGFWGGGDRWWLDRRLMDFFESVTTDD
ncbi:YheT family hydrolase [Marinimicrobium alkaliphilum]|uniref:YheT family hydrolase n=1 Tax=Marinimicrobium alkaliphilum TaxID=2202654 RepID=UPI0013002F32|nr:alpha/beta fold hydrolase [Marinimicrobium alkaliphilum]